MELDEFPPEWLLRRLADLCHICIGRTPARANRAYWDNGRHPWAAISDLNGAELAETREAITDTAIQECRCRPVEPGTLLFSFKLTIGKMAIAGRRLFTNEAIAALPVKAGVELDARFLALALRVVPLLDEASDAAKGTTLNKESLSELHIPVPPLAEQRRLVARIETLTSRLEQARQARQAALAEADQVVQAYRCRLLDSVAAENLTRFGELVTATQLGLVRSQEQQSAGHPWPYLKMNNITTAGTLELSRITRVQASDFEAEKFQLASGDFLFNTRNSYELVGKTAVWTNAGESFLFNNNIMRIRFRPGVSSRFVNEVFLSPPVRAQLDGFKKQTTSVCAIYWKNLKDVLVPLPSVEEQESIADELEALAVKQAELRRLQTETEAELASFTPALLDRAFRGEL